MRKPKLSVIVPVYNVEKYLRDCLDSLAAQTLEDLEVIMVNDGSNDGSGEIIEAYAAKHANFKAFHKENGGLGHTRNFGLRHAQGEYVTFVDSDDMVAEDAYEKMYRSARKTGSDIVTGNVVRYTTKKTFPSALHQKVFRINKRKAHITRDTELMYDTVACNKLFKKSFWEKHGFSFPEGILYEDLPVTIPAHFLATSVDVLTDTVYFWRKREGEDKSITQKRTQLNNFLDRLTVIRRNDEFFREHDIHGELEDEKNFKNLSLDLRLYLNQLDRVDENYVDVFVNEVSTYLQDIPDRVFRRLNAIDRLKYYFVRKQDKDKLLHVLHFQKTRMKRTKVLKNNGKIYGNFPFKDEVPEELLVMNDELKVVRQVESAEWSGSELRIKGFGFIEKLDMDRPGKVQLNVCLKNPETDETVDVPVKLVKRPDVTHKQGVKIPSRIPLRRLYNIHWSGFVCLIDFDRPEIAALGTARLQLWFRLEVDGVTRQFRAGSPVNGREAHPPCHVYRQRRVLVRYNHRGDLFLSVSSLDSAISDLQIKDDFLFLKGWTKFPLSETRLKIVHFAAGIEHEYALDKEDAAGEYAFEVIVPLRQLEETVDPMQWIFFLDHGGERKPLTVIKEISGESFPRDYREIRLGTTPVGNLNVTYRYLHPVLQRFSLKDRKLFIDVKVYHRYFARFDSVEDVKLTLSHQESGKTIDLLTHVPTESSGNDFVYRAESGPVIREGFIDTGKWNVYFEVYGIKDKETFAERRRVFVEEESPDFEQQIESGLKYKPYRTKAGNLSVRVLLHWHWLERGPRRQEVVRKLYKVFRLLPIQTKTVVFQSYWGKSYSCNPRAIYEYMVKQGFDYRFVWLLNNENTPVKGRAKTVRIGSWKYYYYLARGKYFINNANFPDHFIKRADAVEVQTLHGTFLKTMGLDVPGELESEKKRKKFLARCARWDYLLSPSKYMTNITRRCYQFDRTHLEVGFPRNDVLYKRNHREPIEAIKQKLGLPLDKKVILYAPTWRVKNRFRFELDLDEMQERLGNDYIVLLRLHYLAARAVNVTPYRGFAYNFSAYDDIQELYLVSDMLVTDYSSTMFDYANLQRPIYFFTYDLEYYRDQLRGFYIDLEQEAPGPLVKTTNQLMDSIVDEESYQKLYGKKLETFKEKYCQFESGEASRKVVDAVFFGNTTESGSE